MTATISAIDSSRSSSSSPSFIFLRSFPTTTEPGPELPLPEQLPLSSSIADAPLLRLTGTPDPPPLEYYYD
jgi:hypothetical protein